ncbi:maleylpyruvate isomerase family mycothiol-dependent enzyme, partial [Mycobacterium sp. NAZ190054]|uniref:maleylpyruvate isomerase family mycothiol-dependent enzyme n=1 Tax=Mycobacterium sp. NAZ190054 TaxID=1747766 RepID=UPI00079C170B
MAAVRALAYRERERFAELLAGLTAEQWTAPSLCAGWSVRDVAAHTVGYLGQSVPALVRNMIRDRGDVDRLNARLLPAFTARTPAELVTLMARGTVPTGAAGLYGGRVALIECVIHQQDIRRPLGLESDVPEEALRVSLTYARISPVIGGARRTRGVRLVATDLDWSAGRGPEVRGPGEALLLAMTGRVGAV